MKPFMITTTKFKGNRPLFNTSKLALSQKRFVEQNVKQLTKKSSNSVNNFALVMWKNKEDFAAIMTEVPDPQDAVNEYNTLWADSVMAVGNRYDRQWCEDKSVETMFDMLAEGGTWPWPNAGAVFTKQGDYLVVTDLLEAA
jgi:hypothetical protein